jgi:hypothetical protein
MISLPEIETLARRTFRKSFISAWQINKTTIRIELRKDSFIDIFQSVHDKTKFAFHAEISKNQVFRVDCRPERKYLKLDSFPWHFHKATEESVIASPFSTKKRIALIQFFDYIKETIFPPPIPKN